MEIAYNNGHRLNMLVNDLLDMEKLMAGKIAFKMEVIPLEDLLYQAIAENQAYADTYHVRLSLQTGCMGARIAVDRLRFQQIMSNLLSNAAKFSYQGQEITISVSILGDSARIAVADRGCGIPPDFHARVFQKFSQVDSSSSRKKEGSGLGLAITRELVERMDGAIQFHSVVGEGTTFFITFPLAAAP
ncbi:MAG: ATP-binding protein [Cellvibrionaceae bacterium]|nr:ATP-binding protein [Cellvibrionaceae bacterium]